MITYAQNFEDVMLWRALKHIPRGFYIDVGAWSPDIDSVTRHFYEHGWRGINIEPNPTFYEQYYLKRPEDTTLEVAISDSSGTAELYFSSNPGLSSLDASIAKTHEASGCTTTSKTVHVMTLKEVCDTHCQNKSIHFLKVDVEGCEANVLKGNDWNTYRPWIVLVEATRPMSQEEVHEEWEPILVQANYLFAYADGLNRFYIAQEHEFLKKAFIYPPNVFDAFVMAEEVKLKEQVEQIAKDAQEQLLKLGAQMEQMHAHAKEVEKAYTALTKSFSWRLTKPLRLFQKIVRK